MKAALRWGFPPALLLAQVALLWPMEWYRDSLAYVSYARDMAGGHYAPVGDPGAHRFVLLAPVALAYRIFGFNAWSGSIPIIACGVGLVTAGQAAAARLFGARAGFTAGLLLSLCPLTVLYSAPVMGDVPVGFACALAFWGAAVYRQGGSCAALVWAGLAVGLGYWVKETAAFMGVFVALWLWRRREGRVLAIFAAAALAPVLLGSLYVALGTGSVMAPARALEEATILYWNPFKPGGDPMDRLYRWTVEFPLAVLSPHSGEFSLMGPLLWAFIVGTWWGRRREPEGAWSFAAGAAGVMAVLLFWMPMPTRPEAPAFMVQARYLSILAAPAAAGAAAALARMGPRAAAAAALALLVCFVGSSVSVADARAVRHAIYREIVRKAAATGARQIFADGPVLQLRIEVPELDPSIRWRHHRELGVAAEARPEAAVVMTVELYATWTGLSGKWRVVWLKSFPDPQTGRQRIEDLLMGTSPRETRTYVVLRPKGG